MRKTRRGRLPAFAAMALLSGCAGATSDAVTAPPLVAYPRAFQARAAVELEALGPACPLHKTGEGCSTLTTLIEDYGELRARVRGW